MFRLLPVAVAALFFAVSASAQWTSEVEGDAFTGEQVAYARIDGTVLGGSEGQTSLLMRRKGGIAELIWSPPDSYVCSTEMTVQVRFGEGEPEDASVSGSTSNRSIFFSQPWYILHRLASDGPLLIKLTDHCGGYSVVQFEGDPTGALPELSLLSGGLGWTIDRAGFVTKQNGPLQVNFRKIYDGSDDLSFKINVPQLVGKRVNRKKAEGSAAVGGETFVLRALYTSEFNEKSNLVSDGIVFLFAKGQLSSAKLKELVLVDPILKITLDGQDYTLDLSGFDRAAELG